MNSARSALLFLFLGLPVPLVGQVELTEVVRIGSLTGGTMDSFGRIADVAMDPVAGRIYILDAQVRRVTVWTTDGEFRLEFGGPGEGPGEFDGPPSAIALGPDHLLVADGSRVHRFTRDGEPEWTRRTETLSRISIPIDVHASPDSARVVARESEPGRGQFARTYRLGGDGAGAWTHESEWEWVTGTGLLPGSRRHWVSANGTWLLNVPDEYALTNADGTDRLAVRYSPPLLSEDDVRDLIDELRRECEASSIPVRCADALQDAISALEDRVGTAIPPIGGIAGWSTGELLVARSDLSPAPFDGRTARFDVVRLGDGVVEELILPEPIDLQWAGDGWIVGVIRDDFDVDYVVSYRVP